MAHQGGLCRLPGLQGTKSCLQQAQLYMLLTWLLAGPWAYPRTGWQAFPGIVCQVWWACFLVPKWLFLLTRHREVNQSAAVLQMQSYAQCFQDKPYTLLTWLHLLVIDFFQARWAGHFVRACVSLKSAGPKYRWHCRWVARDAQQRRVPAIHSIVLCFMCGPIGILSHMLTHTVWRKSTPIQSAPA